MLFTNSQQIVLQNCIHLRKSHFIINYVSDCIPIRSPEHASVLGNGLVERSVASYTCQAPTVPLGDDGRMECRNGVWSKGAVCGKDFIHFDVNDVMG